MRKLSTLFLMLTCNISAAYAAKDMCVYPKGFAAGLDFAAYQRCQQSIEDCPAGQLSREESCVAKKLTQASCKQLGALAKHLQVDAQMISVKKIADYSMIKIFFPADGGEQYYLLSPNGCLVDTNINPANYDTAFKHEFADKDLYTEVTNAPTYSALLSGGKRFTVSIEGRNQCRACEVLVKVDAAFEFGKSDKLEKVVVLNKVEVSHTP